MYFRKNTLNTVFDEPDQDRTGFSEINETVVEVREERHRGKQTDRVEEPGV